MYQQVRQTIDDLFALKARQLNLKSGDVTPEQESQLEMAVEMITEVMNNWIKVNS